MRKKRKESTVLNKVFALLLILLGLAATVYTLDATAFLFLLLISIPLLVSDQNWIDL